MIIYPYHAHFYYFWKWKEKKTERNNRKQSRLYSILLFFVFFSGQTCKIDFMCKQITGEFLVFLLPIHFIRLILILVFRFVGVCVSEFINIYFNKHTKSAVLVCVCVIWVVLWLFTKKATAAAAVNSRSTAIRFGTIEFYGCILFTLNNNKLLLFNFMVPLFEQLKAIFLCLLLFSIRFAQFFIHSLTGSVLIELHLIGMKTLNFEPKWKGKRKRKMEKEKQNTHNARAIYGMILFIEKCCFFFIILLIKNREKTFWNKKNCCQFWTETAARLFFILQLDH